MTTQQNHFKRSNTPFIFILLLAFSFNNCKKKDTDLQYDFTGKITDINTGAAINGVKITLSKKEVSDGTYNNSYTLTDSYQTITDGKYNLTSPFGTIQEFKFRLDKENYFSIEQTENPDNLTTNSTNIKNFKLQSKGYIRFNLKNSIPFDSSDRITFNSLNPNCENCAKFNLIDITNYIIDSTLFGLIEANRYYKYQYSTTKFNNTVSYIDSVFCPIGDTIVKDIQF